MRSAVRPIIGLVVALSLGCATTKPPRQLVEGHDVFTVPPNSEATLAIMYPQDPYKSRVYDLPAGQFWPQATLDDLHERATQAHKAALQRELTVRAGILFIGLTIGAGLMLAATKPWEARR